MASIRSIDLNTGHLNIGGWTSILALLGIASYIIGAVIEIYTLATFGVDDFTAIKIQYIFSGGIPLALYLVSILVGCLSIFSFVALSHNWEGKDGICKLIELLPIAGSCLLAFVTPLVLVNLVSKEVSAFDINFNDGWGYLLSYGTGSGAVMAYLYISSEYVKKTKFNYSESLKTVVAGFSIIMICFSFFMFFAFYMKHLYVKLPPQFGGIKSQSAIVWFSDEERYLNIFGEERKNIKNSTEKSMEGVLMEKLYSGSKNYLFFHEKTNKFFLIPNDKVLAISPREGLHMNFYSTQPKD